VESGRYGGFGEAEGLTDAGFSVERGNTRGPSEGGVAAMVAVAWAARIPQNLLNGGEMQVSSVPLWIGLWSSASAA
jgi:hypothetical protein